ncbi:MAG: DsbC family protein [Halofilum sp. (in: g-proteobacteria)]|nr:DsbC family protein [Halofilum sp. (in: g-proteobacteria)]
MTLSRFGRPLLAAILCLSAGAALAAEDDQSSTTPAIEALRAHLAEEFPRFQVDAIRPTPLDGVYEVVSNTDVMYMGADGRYLLRGQLIDLQAKRNLTGQRRSQLVHARVEALGEESMVVFGRDDVAAGNTITVFTDPTCPYCRKLHEDVLQMVEQYPVQVRYLMFPRQGLQSGAADQLRDIWCADDPQQALTRAKRGQSVPERDDGCKTPLRQHFQAARAVGVNGTPFLMIGDGGPVFSGYRPTSELLSMLGISPDQGQAQAGASD